MTDAMSPKPNSHPKPRPLSPQEKKFAGLAASPNLSEGARDLAESMRRSAAAELILRKKAPEYAKPHSDPEVEKRWALYRLFRLPLPTPPGGM
jgi:hypothetical protein